MLRNYCNFGKLRFSVGDIFIQNNEKFILFSVSQKKNKNRIRQFENNSKFIYIMVTLYSNRSCVFYNCKEEIQNIVLLPRKEREIMLNITRLTTCKSQQCIL